MSVPMTAVKDFTLKSVDGIKVFRQERGDTFEVIRREDWNTLRREGFAVEGYFGGDNMPSEEDIKKSIADAPPAVMDKPAETGEEKRGGESVTDTTPAKGTNPEPVVTKGKPLMTTKNTPAVVSPGEKPAE